MRSECSSRATEYKKNISAGVFASSKIAALPVFRLSIDKCSANLDRFRLLLQLIPRVVYTLHYRYRTREKKTAI